MRSLGDGIVNIKKEAGWTSHDVVARLRKSVHGTKVGHAGTLDPSATGVLPILIGRGTRIAEYLLEWDKEYRAVLRLGETTDTLDATGTVMERRSVELVTEAAIRQAVSAFTGRIQQQPPMYSAVKVGGVPLYKTARKGRVVDRASREITVYGLDIERIDSPDVYLRVRCSKGTYIRTLCADIGTALGVGGHLLSLERTRVGPLSVEQAVTVQEFESRVGADQAHADVLPLDVALTALPACTVDCDTGRRVLHGVSFSSESALSWEARPLESEWGDGRPLRIKDQEGRLLAIGAVQTEGGGPGRPRRIVIKKVLVPDETVTCVL